MNDLNELWELDPRTRAEVLWGSGAHPNNDVLRALFRSCESVVGIGTFLAMAVQTGLTPNPKYYRGEGRNDPFVWPDGCPVPTPKRATPRKPSKRALERQAQEFYRDNGLFKRLPCGCLEECPGLDWHTQVEVDAQARERALREEHAAWDGARERALADARRDLVDELARVTLNQPIDEDPEMAGEFTSILASVDEP